MLRISLETTLKYVLDKYRQEFAKDDIEEVSEFKWDQLVYDPLKLTFLDFMSTIKNTTTQAFGDRVAEFLVTFLFKKLHVKIQDELSSAEKSETSVERIKMII